MKSLSLLLGLALALPGCKLRDPTPQGDPCAPNPCTEANRGRCTNVDGEARCLCDDGFVTRPSGACEAVSAQNCPEHPGDAAEPDDCADRAKALAPTDAARAQTIEPTGDYDFFAVAAQPNHVYQLSVDAGGALYPRIDLFDDGGVWLQAAERYNAPGAATTVDVRKPSLFFKHAGGTPATYRARVAHSPLDPSYATGGYTILLNDNGFDDFGDGPSASTRIVPPYANDASKTTFNGKLDFPGDQDWFSFEASFSQTYLIAFDPGGALPGVAIYKQGSTTPLLNRHELSTTFQVPTDGVYLVQLYDLQQAPALYAFRFERSNP